MTYEILDLTPEEFKFQSEQRPNTMTMYSGSEPMVTVNFDEGTIVLHEKYTSDEASIAFWGWIANSCPTGPMKLKNHFKKDDN